jgi:GAF domain-containing protein
MSIPPNDALWNAVAGLSQLLLGEESVNTTLQRVATSAVTLIEAVEESGVTVAHDDRPSTDAATGGVVYEIDNFQYDVDQGPCLHALLSGDVVEIPCMRAEHRWPTYAAFAADRGINSSLSIPLTVRGGPSIARPVVGTASMAEAIADGRVGVMNMYSRREGDFSDEERWAALTFAEQGAVAIYNARTYEAAHRLTSDLQSALSSRAVIEQAKGMLMVERQVPADKAFELLRERSQRTNRKLREVAQEMVEQVTGAAPGAVTAD